MYRLQIATTIENISNVKDQRDLVNKSIQIALDRVFEFHDWPYYIEDEGVINTVATYETGTVNVANASTTVTGTNTVWTSAMAGRKIRVIGGNPYYRIASVTDGTHLVLEQPYQGSSNSSAAYTIFKDEYRLNADVDKYKIIRQAQNGVVLLDTHPTGFDQLHPMPQSYADPVTSTMIGTKLDTYNTGSISISASASTITGVGTAWTSVEGLGRMSMIRIGTNVHTIKSVDSATQITIYETSTAGSSASTDYEITLNNLLVQLHSIPDSARILYYRYFRIPEVLANDYDVPDMSHAWHWLLMYGGLSIVLMQKGDLSKSQQEAEARFINGLEMMKLKLGSFAPDRIYHRKSIDRMARNLDGLENSAFDRRWSQP